MNTSSLEEPDKAFRREESGEARMSELAQGQPDAGRSMPASIILQKLHDEAPADHFTLDWLMSNLHKQSFGLIMLVLAIVAVAPGVSVVGGLLLLIPAFQNDRWAFRSRYGFESQWEKIMSLEAANMQKTVIVIAAGDVADRPMSLERGATFPSVARPRRADPKPRYALLSQMYRTDQPPVQWFGPSLCDYAWGVTADVSSGKITGGVHR